MLPFYASAHNPTGEMLPMLIDSIDLTPNRKLSGNGGRVGAVPSVPADVPFARPGSPICRRPGGVSVERGGVVGRTTTMP